MKKLLTILLLLVAIAACGKKEQAPVEPESTQTEMTTEAPAETTEMMDESTEMDSEMMEMDSEAPMETTE